MTMQYFSGQVRGLRGPGIPGADQAKIDGALPRAGGVMVGVLDLDGNRVIGLPDPASPSDAAPKSYVDSALGGTADALQSNLDAQVNRLDAVPKLVATAIDRPIISNPRSSIVGASYVGGNFDQYFYGVNPAQDELSPGALIVWLGGLAGKTTIEVTPIDRPLTTGDGGDARPGTHADDVIGEPVTYPIVTTVANFRTNAAQPVRLAIAAMGPLMADTIRFFRIRVLDGSNNPQAFGAGLGLPVASAVAGWSRGWLRDGSTGTYGRVSEPGSSGNALALIVTRAATRQANSDIGFVEQQQPTPIGFGNTQTPPVVVHRDTQGVNAGPSPQRTFAAVANITINDEALTLTNGGYASLAYEPLGGSIVVTRVSDSATLTEGVDYRVDYAAFALVGLQASVVPVTVDYTGLPVRYDMVYEDISTFEQGVASGTARGLDACEYVPHVSGKASHPEFAIGGPSLPIGKRPLYAVRTNWLGSEPIPVHDWRGSRRLGQWADEESWLSYCREYLAPVLEKARQGGTIIQTGYGTSLTAQGDDQRIDVANGDRDALDFYQVNRIAADTLARVTMHNGDLGLGLHQRLGWNWGIKEALEMLGGDVTYRNRGIGGSTTGTATRGANNPARLAYLYADAADLIVADMGENDKGQLYIYADTVSLVQSIRANSPASKILLVPPPFNARFSPNITQEMAGNAYEQVKQAALDCGVAWLHHALVAGPGNEGCLGHSSQDWSLQNGINHPGPGQMVALRDLAARIFRA